MLRVSLLAATLLVGTLGACKKDKADSRADILVDKNWQISALTTALEGTQTGTQDVYSLLPACQKDNFTRFNANKTLEVNEGQDVCPGMMQQVMGGWEINADQSRLAISAPNAGLLFALPFDIVELTNEKLVLQSIIVQPELKTITTITFQAR